VKVRISINPLLPFENVDDGLPFLQRLQRQNRSRRPHLEDLAQVLAKLFNLSLMQSQFGIPPEKFDSEISLPASRIAFRFDSGRIRPYVVATLGFQEAQNHLLAEDGGRSVTDNATVCITHFDPEARYSQMVNELSILPGLLVYLRSGCVFWQER
jgi:hypothetical protein